MGKSVALTTALILATWLPTPWLPSAHAAQWMDVATISSTLGNNVGRLCIGGGRTDLGCPADAPLLDSARGLLTVPGDLRVAGSLYVSGSQNFDGVTFANGGISASSLTINGQAIASGTPDRIVSTSANIVAGADGLIRFSTGSVSNTAYLDNLGRLVNAGVSTTGPISGTGIYSNGEIHSTADIFSGNRFWGNSVWLDNGGSIQWSNNVGIYGNGLDNRIDMTTKTSYVLSIVSNGYVGLGGDFSDKNPSTTLQVSGSLRLSAGPEACDTNRLGAIKYASGSFYVCRNTTTGWEVITAGSATGISKFASLTDISYDVSNSNLAGPSSTLTNTTYSTAFGMGALNGAANTASLNSAFGYMALANVTTGGNNQAFGPTALLNTTTGNGNAAFGNGVMRVNTAGSFNTSLGGQSLYVNTTGSHNAVAGFNAGFSNTTGSYNVGMGESALQKNVSGNYNIGIGYASNYFNTTGSNNVALGYRAGYGVNTVTVISNSTLLGSFAGQGLTTAQSNTLVGYNAGGGITSGNNNLVLGANTTPYSNTGDNQLSIGNAIWGDIGSGTGNTNRIGINVASPTTALHVSGTIEIANSGEACDTSRLGAMRYANGSFDICRNTTNGWEPLSTATSTTTPSISTGASGSLVYRNEYGYLYATNTLSISSTTGSIGIGAGAPASLGSNGLYASGNISGNNLASSNGVSLGGNNYVSWGVGNTKIGGNTTNQELTFTTSNTEALRIVSTGNVGIGTASPQWKLDVNGTTNASYLRSANNIWSGLGSVGAPAFSTIGGTDTGMYFPTASTIGFSTLGAEALRITSTGLVGIGTTAPTTALQVSGAVLISGTNIGSNSLYIGGVTDAGQNGTRVHYSRTTAASYFDTVGTSINFRLDGTNGNTSRMIITGSGLVGIGTNTPSATLHVAGGKVLISNNQYYQVQSPGGVASNLIGLTSGDIAKIVAGSNGLQIMDTAQSNTRIAISSAGLVGIGGIITPSTTLQISGTLQMADSGETCDANRLGAIKYTGNEFYVCRNGTSWESFTSIATGAASLADRITSNSQAGVTANATGYISLTTGGVTGTVYFNPAGVLVNAGVSTTGPISGTSGYFTNGITIPTSGTGITMGSNLNSDTSYITANGRARFGYNGTNVSIDDNGAAKNFTLSLGGANRFVIGGAGAYSAFSTPMWFGTNSPINSSNLPSTTIQVSGTGSFSGSVGIGTSNPTASLEISGSQVIGDSSTNRLTLNSASIMATQSGVGVPLFLNTSNGSNSNVNLGTSGAKVAISMGGLTPSTTLQVSGTIKMAYSNEACDTLRLGAMRYTSGTFSICQNATNGWEPLSTSTSSTTPSISTGASGSLVYRNEYGYLYATNTLSISSTTGSVGIGAGPPIALGNNGLYATGDILSQQRLYVANGPLMGISGSVPLIRSVGGLTDPSLSFSASLNTPEALRIVSTGNVGIGTSTPATALDVSGAITLGGKGLYSVLAFRRPTDGAINSYLDMGDAQNFRFSNNNGGGYYTWQTNSIERMRLDTNGYLGIGTTAPSATLHVVGAAGNTSSGLIIGSTTGTAASRLAIYPTGNFSTTMKLLAFGSLGFQSANGSNMMTLDGGSTPVANIYYTVGIGGVSAFTPSTTLDISGTIKMRDSGEACDTSRLGAIKYTTNEFYVCRNTGTGWESFTSIASGAAALADRITSNSQAGVTANATGYISLTTGGVTGTAYFQPDSVLVNAGISSTGGISSTYLYSRGYITAGSSMTAGLYLLYSSSGGTAANPAFTINTQRDTGMFFPGAAGNPAIAFTTSGTESLRIVSSGNVGIGTSIPSTTLHVWKGDSGFNGALNGRTVAAFEGSNSAGTAISILGPSTGNQSIYFGNNSNEAAGQIQYVASTDRMSFATNGGGNVFSFGAAGMSLGINALPSTSLMVSGTIRMSDGGEACDTNRLGAMKYSAGTFQICQNTTNGWEPLSTSGVSSTIDRIISGTTQAIAYNNTSLSLVTAGTERMVIGTNGNIGMGVQPITGVPLTIRGGRLDLMTTTGNNLLIGDRAGNANTGSNNVGVGPSVLWYNTGNYVTAFGGAAAINNSGTYVTAVGWNSAQANSGSYLTAQGMYSAQNNISANVTAIGYSAGASSNTQANLTAVGYNAASNNSGTNVTAIGNQAAQNNTQANVTAIGYQSALNNSGANLAAFGQGAAQNNTNTGLTAIGNYAGQANTGTNSTLLGYFAGNANTAGNVSIIGYQAGQYNTGSNLTSLGAFSARYNVGSYNTTVGMQSMSNNSTGAFNTVLGANAGLGVSNSSAYSGSVLVGYNAGSILTTGNSNTLIGYNTGAGITTGSNNLLLGYNLSPFSPTGSNQLNIANAIFGDYGASLATRIGINVTSPTANLEVSGTVSATRFVGDGSGLTNLSGLNGDRITSGTTQAIAYNNTSLSLVTAGTERLTIGTNGQIGINNSAPETTQGKVVHLYNNANTGTADSNATYIAESANRNVSYQGRVGSSGAVSLQAMNWASGLSYGQVSAWANGNNPYLAFYVSGTTSSPIERMRITDTGQIGIGIAAPSYTIHVSATGNSQIYSAGTTGGYFFGSRNFNNTTPAVDDALGSIGFGGENTNPAQSATAANIASFVDATGGSRIKGRLVLSTSDGNGNMERLRITSAGLVGIGTTAPSYTLDVSGSGRFGNSNNNAHVYIDRSAGKYGMLEYTTSGSERWATGVDAIAEGGSNAGSNYFLNRYSDAGAYLGEPFIISRATGYVGIGLDGAIPTTSLEVSGTVSATRFVGDGSGLTGLSGASGDRITSGTTQAIAYQNTSLSLVTAGTERMVIGTAGTIGIAQQPTTLYALSISGSAAIANGRLSLNSGAGNNVLVGSGAGAANTGSNIAAFGYNTANANTGGNLAAFGHQAAQNNIGSNVTALGYTTAQNNTSNNLTAVGYGAAQSNTQTNVTAMGVQAAQNNSGTQLSAVGMYAAQNNAGGNVAAMGYLTANNNIGNFVSAFGNYAAQNNTGQYVTAIGDQAATNNTGINVTAVGTQAGSSNTANYTALFGYQAGQNNTQANITALGYTAGQFNTGGGLTAVGNAAGANNTVTGATLIGNNAGQFNAGAFMTAVGFNAAVYNIGINNTATGNGAMQYKAVGTNNAVYGFQAGTGVSNSTAYSFNSLFGAYAGTALTTGGSNTLLGYNSGAGITTGTNNLILGASTSPLDNTGSNQLNIANAIFGQYGSSLAAKIGINLTSPTANLEVSGTISATAITINGVPLGSATSTYASLTDITYSAANGNLSGPASFNGTFTGTNNVAFGQNTLKSLTSGSNNLAIGPNALVSLTSGANNLAIGYFAMSKATSLATQNTAIGYQSLQANTGSYNTALGLSSANANTTGQENTGIGYRALESNAIGSYSTALGAEALRYTRGTGNTGVGVFTGGNALNNISNSTFLGAYAGQLIATGSQSNTLIGYNAGGGITTGSNNLMLGTGTSPYSNTADNQLNIAGAIMGNYGAPLAANIGINVTSPTANLEVSGTISATSLLINGVPVTGSSTPDRIISGTTQAIAYNGGSLSLVTAGTERMVIGTAGLVGIGQQPVAGQALSVSGSATISNYLTVNNSVLSVKGTSLAINNSALTADNEYTGFGAITGGQSASGNTAFGFGTLFAASSGAANTAMGDRAMYSTGTGHDNVALGYAALFNNTTGNFNVALGSGANSFANNSIGGVYVGYGAGSITSSGQYNTMLGYQAGNAVTTGSNNILIGNTVQPVSNTTNYGLNIGNSLFGDLTNAATTGGAAKIGINTTAPTANLEVSGTVSATRFVGDGSLLTNLPAGASDRITSGTTTAIAYNNTSLSLVTAGTERLVIGTSGLVGIAQQPTSGYALSVSGSTYITGRLNMATAGGAVFVGLNAGSSASTTATLGTAVGYGAGQYNTGNYLSALGSNAAYNNTGANLTAVGYNAANNNTGASVLALGYNSAINNSGANLTSVGVSAAASNTGQYLVAVGQNAAQNNTLSAVTAIGYSAAQSSIGLALTAVGYQAAQNNSATNITAVGYQTGQTNTASYAALFGYQAGQNNTGGFLTAIGYGAGQNNTGTQVTAIGTSAGASNTGNLLTAVGYGAGQLNASGGLTAIGNIAAQYNTTGNYNTAVGYAASQFNSGGGTFNVVVGGQAGQGVSNSSSYSRNTLIGNSSGQSLTTGSSNTLLGYNTGAGISTGNNNLIIGANTSPYSNTADNQLNIANAIFGQYGAPLAARIGINVTSPTANLEVSGTISATSLVLNGVPFTGGATSDRITSNTTQIIAYGASNTLSFATNNVERMVIDTNGKVGIGQQPGTDPLTVAGIIRSTNSFVLSNSGGLTNGGTNSMNMYALNNLTFTTSNTTAMTITSNSNVGIGTTTPTYPLDIADAIAHTQINGYNINFSRNGSSYIRANNASGGLVFTTGGTTARMVIDSLGTTYMLNSAMVGSNLTPSTTLSVSGTIQISNSGEACDTSRLGAIKYSANEFSFCRNGTSWETLSSITGSVTTDRLVSGTASAVLSGSTGTLTVSSTISATMVNIGTNPATSCGSGQYGTIKVENGRMYLCRQ